MDFDDEDVGYYDPTSGQYQMVFDDDVWDISGEIDALARVSDSQFLLSTDWTERNLPGMSQDAGSSDVVKCDTQTMLCEMYFDASDVGLSDEVNGVTVMEDGSLLFVLEWYFSVGGVSGMGEDVVRFIPTSLGDNTTGSFEMFLDGSDVGIDEDIDGIWWDDALGSLCITFEDDYETPNDLLVRDEDVVCFNATQYGASTTGSFAQDLMLDFSEVGNTVNVSAIHLEP